MDELDGLVEHSPMPILVADDARTVTRVNERAAALFGRGADALVGQSLDELFRTTDRDGITDHLAPADGEDRRQLGAETDVYVDSAGESVPVDLTASVVDECECDPQTDGEQAPGRLVLSVQPVREREQLLGELRASEERYRRLLDASPAPTIVFGGDGAIRYANDAVDDLLCDRTARDVTDVQPLEFVHPDEREDSRARIETVLEDGEPIERLERRLVTETGETRHTVLSSVPVTYEGERAAQVVLADVTALKERERALARQNARLDRFASIVSHDLRNPLSVVRSSLELAAEGDGEHVERGHRAIDRMETLIDDLLALARHGETPAETQPVPLADVATLAWEAVETADADLHVRANCSVEAEESRLRELLENLFRNAVENAGEDASVTVDGTGEGFYVADDGPGIPPAEREAVFESGYSTGDEGTGIGLTIVREIADAHGWTVSVTESADGGARFEFVTG